MTMNEPRVRDRYTFSLTGIPVFSSYASVPVIPSDRIRKIPKAGLKGPQAAHDHTADTPAEADALQAGYA